MIISLGLLSPPGPSADGRTAPAHGGGSGPGQECQGTKMGSIARAIQLIYSIIICMYIYREIEREKERGGEGEGEAEYIYIYIHIYRERERERQRDIETCIQYPMSNMEIPPQGISPHPTPPHAGAVRRGAGGGHGVGWGGMGWDGVGGSLICIFPYWI